MTTIFAFGIRSSKINQCTDSVLYQQKCRRHTTNSADLFRINQSTRLTQTVKRGKLSWFGHVCRYYASSRKSIPLQGTGECGRRKGRPRRSSLKNNVKYWRGQSLLPHCAARHRRRRTFSKLSNFTRISRLNWHTAKPDMTSLATSGWLQKYNLYYIEGIKHVRLLVEYEQANGASCWPTVGMVRTILY